MLGPHLKAQDPSTFAKTCVFDLSAPSPDIYLIIRLEKVLQGDINEVVEPYLRDDKNKDKVKANALAACERLGSYRMPFAWTYISLMHVINPSNAAASSSQVCSSLNIVAIRLMRLNSFVRIDTYLPNPSFLDTSFLSLP
jgi:hypothetical protein